MIRYKAYFYEQLLLGIFEYALNHIEDKELDFSIFLNLYNNDNTGPTADAKHQYRPIIQGVWNQNKLIHADNLPCY